MKIHAIQTGTVQIKKNQQIGKGSGSMRMLNILLGRSWTEPLPIFAWAIEHLEGVIVIDTGDTAKTSQPGYFPAWHPYYRSSVRFRIAPEDEIGWQLRDLGITKRDVRKVILTHFHTDHAGGLHHFPESQILVSGLDYRQALGFAGKLRGYLPNRWPDWFHPTPIAFEKQPVGPFEEIYRVTTKGDVVIVKTPGHTSGHISVIVKDDGMCYYLAGDTSYNEEILMARKVDGVSPDRKAALRTMEKIIEFGQEQPVVYLPSHDPDSPLRLKHQLMIRRGIGEQMALSI